MSIKYRIYKDLLQIAGGLHVSSRLQKKVDLALKELETNPCPDGCASSKDGALRIWIQDGSEEVAIIYKVYDETRVILLVRIEPRSLIRKAIDAIDDLFNFGP
jgi:mRNA-degrading endonuclease RelE of RelBE toxin-antitoxin system